jgi:hypothetical protein
LPSGPDKRLTERFALSPDGKRILYSFELTDPDDLAEPVSYEMEWVYSPDLRWCACLVIRKAPSDARKRPKQLRIPPKQTPFRPHG